MRELVIPVLVGLAVGLGWLIIWAVALHAFDISLFIWRPEERAAKRERIVRMGKLRYILMFGVLGYGFAIGLGIAVADVVGHVSTGWVGAVVKLVLWTVLFGWFHGVRTWNESFRGETPFPPHFPPQR